VSHGQLQNVNKINVERRGLTGFKNNGFSKYQVHMSCNELVAKLLLQYFMNLRNHKTRFFEIPIRYNTIQAHSKIELRKFPYPFKAGLAISSDIDGTTTLEEFINIQSFLNTNEYTPLGKGLGLEIGNSFWMYSINPKNKFTYFKGITNKPSDSAAIIISLIKSGYLDTIHTYGDFNKKGGFTRKLAIEAIDTLKKNNCYVKIWINHGDKHNTQNIGILQYCKGDDPGKIEYHTDQLLDYGIKFIWVSKLTHFIGQDRKLNFREFVNWFLFRPFQRLHDIARALVGHNTLWIIKNDLLQEISLDDGQKIWSFVRYGFWDKASSCDLINILNTKTLNVLKKNKGYMIVYTHLGKKTRSDICLCEKTQNALKYLANEYKNGEIYVTTTSKLLTYNLTNRYLDWTKKYKDNFYVINIKGIKDPTSGYYIPPLSDLQGMTFYTPDPSKTKIFLREQEIKDLVINPPDYTDRLSISIPLTSLSFPKDLIRSRFSKKS